MTDGIHRFRQANLIREPDFIAFLNKLILVVLQSEKKELKVEVWSMERGPD